MMNSLTHARDAGRPKRSTPFRSTGNDSNPKNINLQIRTTTSGGGVVTTGRSGIDSTPHHARTYLQRREVVLKQTTLTLAAVVLTAAMLAIPSAAPACELIHLKRIMGPLGTPIGPPPPDASLCWTGCPFKIAGEQDLGKGRLIVKKGDGAASVQAIITLEKNLNTGIEYEHTTARTTDYTCTDLAVIDPALDARVQAATPFPPCTTGDFKVKYVKPLVCLDQTLNCASRNQKSLKVLHDWDAVDDLTRGIDVVRDGVTFSHSPKPTLNVWFHMCCGDVADFGTGGDPFELDTYAVIRDPAGNCRAEILREGARNSGDPLPVAGVDQCS